MHSHILINSDSQVSKPDPQGPPYFNSHKFHFVANVQLRKLRDSDSY